MLVADEVGVLQCLEVVNAVGRAQGPGGFVLQAATRTPILGLVLNGEVGLVDLADATAGNGAAKAGLVGDQMGLAVCLAGFCHRFGRDIAGPFKLNVTVIAGGQRPISLITFMRTWVP